MSTPPGTKVRLIGTMVVQNSFILLKKTSVEVLGGTVEHLIKKWNMQKASFWNIFTIVQHSISKEVSHY